MPGDQRAVMAIFHSRTQLENAVGVLRADGFRSADVSALLPTQESTKEFAHTMTTKLPEGATAGGAAGALIGGALGWLAGIGTVALPGVGPFLAAGPLMGLFAGVGMGSAVGGLAGALIGIGFPEYEARRFEGMVREGGYLISVHCDTDEWAERAKKVLEETGGTDISSTAEASGSHQSGAQGDHDIPVSRHL